MSEPLAQVDIEREIVRLAEKAEVITQQLGKRAREAAEADVAYKIAHAKAFLVADGAQYLRDAQATVATEDELAARKSTEALLISAQEAGRNVRAQLDALRSINANLRHLVTGG